MTINESLFCLNGHERTPMTNNDDMTNICSFFLTHPLPSLCTNLFLPGTMQQRINRVWLLFVQMLIAFSGFCAIDTLCTRKKTTTLLQRWLRYLQVSSSAVSCTVFCTVCQIYMRKKAILWTLSCNVEIPNQLWRVWAESVASVIGKKCIPAKLSLDKNVSITFSCVFFLLLLFYCPFLFRLCILFFFVICHTKMCMVNILEGRQPIENIH